MSATVTLLRQPEKKPSLSPDAHNRLRSCFDRLEQSARDWALSENALQDEIIWSNHAPVPYEARTSGFKAQIKSAQDRMRAELSCARGILHVNKTVKTHLRQHPDVLRYEERLQRYQVALTANLPPEPATEIKDFDTYFTSARSKRA